MHWMLPSSRAVVTATRVVLWKLRDMAGANRLVFSSKNTDSPSRSGLDEYTLS